jgi:hypothetical protein
MRDTYEESNLLVDRVRRDPVGGIGARRRWPWERRPSLRVEGTSAAWNAALDQLREVTRQERGLISSSSVAREVADWPEVRELVGRRPAQQAW